jgi:plasmid replication initiation protein
MKINNKDVIQSYLLTTARYDFNVYEKRILFRLVECCQNQIEGQKLNKDFTMNPLLFGGMVFTMPIKGFLNGEEDKNHARVKEALTLLNNKRFEYEDDKIWKPIRLIEKPVLNKTAEYVTFEVHQEIFEAILDFSKGFRKFELKTAMEFESVYAMRFYELFSKQKSPIEYTIDNLKLMFQVQDKYNQPADFIKRVVIAAQKELDKKSPYSFKFEPKKKGKKMHSILFIPVFIAKNRDEGVETKEVIKKLNLKGVSPVLTPLVTDYLKQNFTFTDAEIKNNLQTFLEADERFDLVLELSKLREPAMKKAKPKGWTIGALKKMIQANAAKNLGIDLK